MHYHVHTCFTANAMMIGHGSKFLHLVKERCKGEGPIKDKERETEEGSETKGDESSTRCYCGPMFMYNE